LDDTQTIPPPPQGYTLNPPPPSGYKLNPPDDSDITQPIASVRTSGDSYSIGDKVNIGGQDAYVVGHDAHGKPMLDTVPPPPRGYSVNKITPPSLPPMSRAEADQYFQTLAAGGTKPVQLPKPPSFAQTALVDPESPVFGEPIKSAVHPDTRNGRNLVPVQDVAAVRQQMQYEAQHPDEMAQVAHSQAMDTSLPLAERLANRAGLEARKRTELGQAVSNVNDQYLNYVGNKGADAGESFAQFMAKHFQDDGTASPGEIGTARSIGKNVARMVADPVTQATILTGGVGGKLAQATVAGLFSAGAAKQSYDAAGQLGSIWDRDDISKQQKAEMASDLVLNTAMAGMAGSHAVKVPFLSGADPLLSQVPVEYRTAVKGRINSILNKTGGVLSRAASTAGDVAAEVANTDRENVPTQGVTALRRAIPKVPADSAETALPLIRAAANDAGLKTVTASDLLDSPPDKDGTTSLGLIGQAKNEVLAQAHAAAGPGRTIADMTPQEMRPFQEMFNALDDVHDHIQQAQEEETAELKKAADRGKIPATKAAALVRMGMGAGKVAVSASAGPALGRMSRVLLHAYGIPSGFNDLVTGVKGLIGAGGKLSPTLDENLNAALGKTRPAASGTFGANPDTRTGATPYQGDTTVQHDSLIFPPETPHGNARMLRDEPNPRFQLSSATTNPVPQSRRIAPITGRPPIGADNGIGSFTSVPRGVTPELQPRQRSLIDILSGKPQAAPEAAPKASGPQSYADLPRRQQSAVEEYLAEVGRDKWKPETSVFQPRQVAIADLEGAKNRPLYPSVKPSLAGLSRTSGPILLDSDMSVIDGMHRVADAIKSGKTTIDALVRTQPRDVFQNDQTQNNESSNYYGLSREDYISRLKAIRADSPLSLAEAREVLRHQIESATQPQSAQNDIFPNDKAMEDWLQQQENNSPRIQQARQRAKAIRDAREAPAQNPGEVIVPRGQHPESIVERALLKLGLPALREAARAGDIDYSPDDTHQDLIAKIMDAYAGQDEHLENLAETLQGKRGAVPAGPRQKAPIQDDDLTGKLMGSLEGVGNERSRGFMDILRGQQDRRLPQNAATRQNIDQMSEAEAKQALRTSDITGLPNRRAFIEASSGPMAKTHPHVGFADIDDFKDANTKFGEEAVDQHIFPAVGDAFRAAMAKEPGVQFFHRSGDEFLARANDPAAITRAVDHVNNILKDAVFTIQKPDGSIVTQKGIGLSHGIGTDEPTAKIDSANDKQSRKLAGLRTGSRDKTTDQVQTVVSPTPQGDQASVSQLPERKSLLDIFGGRGNGPRIVRAADLQPDDPALVPVADLNADPSRFQYKGGTDEQGVTNALKQQTKYDSNKGGVLLVWRDPANGNVYVVNGHHRFELAKRAGEENVLVKMIDPADAPTAEDAKVVGAETNISEGHGSIVDAARFFKAAGIKTAQDAMNRNLPMGQAKVTDGLAMSRLDSSIIDKVEAGDIPEGRAVAIGKITGEPAQQDATLQAIAKREARTGKTLTNGEAESIARQVRDADMHMQQGADLFGAFNREQSLFGEQAEIDDYILKQLSTDKRTFGAVASKTRAETLGKVKNQQINAEENQRISERAAQAAEMYKKLVNSPGPINNIRKDAAKELANRYSKPQAVKAKAYERIRQELQGQLGTMNSSDAEGTRP
jgi:GGDEF domain-containing protein